MAINRDDWQLVSPHPARRTSRFGYPEETTNKIVDEAVSDVASI